MKVPCILSFLLSLCPSVWATEPSHADVDAALRAADELEIQGAYDAARRQLRGTMRQLEPLRAAPLGLQVCALWQRQGQLEVARGCYLDVVHTVSDADLVAQARYQAAVAALAQGSLGTARQELTDLLNELPYTDGARRAFVLARSLHRDSGGATQEADFLLGVASRLAWVSEPGASRQVEPGARRLLAEALVELGRIRLNDHSDPWGAVRVLERALGVGRGTVWEDDAMIWLARALRFAGRQNEALTMYQELVDAQQDSWFMGSYTSEFYDDALFGVGEVLEEQQRFDEAYAAYTALFERAPTSRLLDDVAFRRANLVFLRGHDRAPLTQFLTDYPESRHIPTARRTLAR